MNIPAQTAEIFEVLSRGQFICSNSSNIRIARLYDILEDETNYETLYKYFLSINFILEKGDEYFHFSRKESKADMERKLEAAYRWIDVVDFFKTFDSSFSSGYSFSPSHIAVEISVQAVLKSKADALKNLLKMDERLSYADTVLRLAETLVKDGFAELENDILKSYKVLSSFKYLEELINNIHISEDIQNEIPQ